MSIFSILLLTLSISASQNTHNYEEYKTIYGQINHQELLKYINIAKDKCKVKNYLQVCNHLLNLKKENDEQEIKKIMIRIYEHEKTIRDVETLLIKK